MGLAVALLGESASGAGFAPVSDNPGARPLVAVARARDADGICQEIATRIVAELMADGVPVMALTCATIDAACLAIPDTRAAATVLVQRWGGIPGVEVRAGDAIRTDRGRSRTGPDSGRVQRLAEADSGGGPAALAVRTVELLRAMLLEGVDAPAPAPSSVPPVRAQAATEQLSDSEGVPEGTWVLSLPSAPTGPHKIVITVGVAMIGSFAGLGAGFGPALRFGRRTLDHVDLSVFLAGPAFARDQHNPMGSVTVSQELAAIEADLLAMPWNGVVLRTGAGIGLYHIHVDGHVQPGDSVLTGTSGAGSSAAVIWSAGAVANLRPDVGLFLDARLFLVTPTPVVLLNGSEVGRAGNPGIVLTSGIELRI